MTVKHDEIKFKSCWIVISDCFIAGRVQIMPTEKLIQKLTGWAELVDIILNQTQKFSTFIWNG